MTIRFIVRPPRIKRTPKRLAALLQARRTAPVNGPTQFDVHQDLFLAYPSVDKVLNADINYNLARIFYTCNKPEQRILLHQSGIPIVPVFYERQYYGKPELEAGRTGYIQRPLRHRAGQGFLFTNTPPLEDGLTYTSICIPKTKEFRVIYYKGKRVSTYLKTNPNNLPSNDVWSFANGCVFHTVTRPENDILKHINFYENLDNNKYIKAFSLCAIDILFYDANAFLCEVNLCPGISIRRTLQAISNIEASL